MNYTWVDMATADAAPRESLLAAWAGFRDLFDPEQNVMGGVRYLRDLLETFDNDLRLALAAYNAGENSVLRYGGVPPYPETVNYVNRVMRLHNAYRNRS